MSLITYNTQDICMTSPNETKYIYTRDYVKLVDEDWRNISKIPIERQKIPVLMRCVKSMLNIPDETEYVYKDEKEISYTTLHVCNFNLRLLEIMRGMEGLRYSS